MRADLDIDTVLFKILSSVTLATILWGVTHLKSPFPETALYHNFTPRKHSELSEANEVFGKFPLTRIR